MILERGVDDIYRVEHTLMRRFCEGVSSIPGVTVYGDFSADRRCAIVALNIRDYDSSAVSDELAVTYGIATRPGRPLCATDASGPGHNGAGSRALQLFLLQHGAGGGRRHRGHLHHCGVISWGNKNDRFLWKPVVFSKSC